MCKAAGAEEILALSDSQLIVSQVNGTYEAKEPTMVKYMQAVHQEVEPLKSFEVRQVPRSENNQVDALSKLASSASCDTPRHVFWESIIFDNGPQFETPKLKEWLAEHGIHSCFASVGCPQANGQVEAFKKIISEGIKKKLDEAKGLWADELPNVLWSIRTTAKNSTGETPFLLAYGAEAVLPIEMCEPTLRVMLYDENAKWEMMKVALDLLPEVRGNAALRQQLYKIRMAREYNKKVSNRVLKVGDFVLQKMESTGRANEQGKLTPIWERPYEIYDERHNRPQVNPCAKAGFLSANRLVVH
ncbi:uncharacterized protein [Spinacia oleracea]|uniref:Integrase catalytic domain-containing protein n=1 Tax=Spinacia oleracea TaxID=3562 RepID=A0ABM3RIM9_SPIOL|nr:uncharacterized protein LOC130469954 [Spinacia oleracea]